MLIKGLNSKNNRGYIIAEAAILMPVFLFSVVLLLYMVKIMHFQEIVHFEASKNMAEMCWQSQIAGSSYREHMYESRIYYDVKKKVDKEININAGISDNNEVYRAEIKYPIALELPFGLFDDITIRDVIVARKWSGGDTTGEVLGFDAMERDDGNRFVFIFPRYGERYHEGGCRYLFLNDNGYFICVTLSEAYSGGFTPCKVCH